MPAIQTNGRLTQSLARKPVEMSKKRKTQRTAQEHEAWLQCRRRRSARNPQLLSNTVTSLINPPRPPIKFSHGPASKCRHIVKDGKPVSGTIAETRRDG